jgi:hypothetical protein
MNEEAQLSIVQRAEKIDIFKKEIISSTKNKSLGAKHHKRDTALIRDSQGDRHRTKPEAGRDIGSIPTLLKLVPALVLVAFGLNSLVNTPPIAQDLSHEM